MSHIITYSSWRVVSWGAFNQSPDQEPPNLQTLIPTVAFKHGREMEMPAFLKSVLMQPFALWGGIIDWVNKQGPAWLFWAAPKCFQLLGQTFKAFIRLLMCEIITYSGFRMLLGVRGGVDSKGLLTGAKCKTMKWNSLWPHVCCVI